MKHEGNKLHYLRDNKPKEFHMIFKRKTCTRSQLTTDDFLQYFKYVCNDNDRSKPNITCDSFVTEES